MFTNECLGDLHYEATTAAIVMAGLFLTWLVEYVSHRGARKYWARSQYNDELVSVVVLELGIIFHSVRKSPTPHAAQRPSPTRPPSSQTPLTLVLK